MAFFGVTKEKISKVMDHPNADRLSLAQVESMAFTFVTGKNQFQIGDVVLYIPLDALLPLPVLEKLNLVGKLSGPNKNRVKTLKLRGVPSQGIVAEVSKFLTPEQMNLSSAEITALLGVTKYEPPVQISTSGILTGLPDGYSTYDIEGADRNQAVIDEMMNMDVVITEKMEGTNFSAGKNETGVFVNQRNNSIVEKDDVANSYWEVARSSGLLDKIKQLDTANIGVYAEFCGPKIQDNIYGLKQHTLFVFDIKENFQWLSFNEFKARIEELGVQMAPVLFEGKLKDFLQGRSVQEASNGPSVVNPKTLREGIVIKPLVEQRHPQLGRLIIKQRSPQYLAVSDN
jgi:RNA ligase (TIGR02306 family)